MPKIPYSGSFDKEHYRCWLSSVYKAKFTGRIVNDPNLVLYTCREISHPFLTEEIFADRLPKCTDCESLVKPDIVFFGESLPPRFAQLVMEVRMQLVTRLWHAAATKFHRHLVGGWPTLPPPPLPNSEMGPKTLIPSG